ncbi:MAG: M48 family metalloprotease [Spirochaetaceae bacterium]|jgi:predicted Zn-dependent protease|nr:M48 family metalloprotease [Spirochaetaceae bacterium]
MKKINVFFIVLGGLALSLFITCASSKEKTDEGLQNLGIDFDRQNGEITPEEEYYIGRAVAANITAKYAILDNPGLTGYVNKICGALTINSEKPEIFNGYHVRILDSDEINAFATSGGHIFITKGFLGATASEDGLAAVIAHEVAHIQLRHAAKQIEDLRFVQQLSDVAGKAADALNIEQDTKVFADSVNSVVDKLMTNGYSQSQELEADSMALALLAGAGYTPSALVEVLNTLKSQQSSAQLDLGLEKTHPSPDIRLANVNAKVGAYSVEDTRSYRTARYQTSK